MRNFFDIQLNGYGGVDFHKDDLTGEALHTVCQKLQAAEVGGILATITTEKIDVMAGRLARIVALRGKDPLAQKMIPGFHIEGPFINENPGFRGAHPADAIHPAHLDEMKQLLDAAGGLTKLVTLAPERDQDLKMTKMLVKQGVKVAGGHCDPSLDQLKAACDAGLTLFTHLGNGCPMQTHRHDNIVQRVLSLRDRIWCCFIADGAHVPFVALKNYLALTGTDHAVVVTDGIAAAGMGPGRYHLGRWEIEVGEDMVVWAPDRSHFVGAGITMPQTLANLIGKVGLTEKDALKLVVDNPRKAIGLS